MNVQNFIRSSIFLLSFQLIQTESENPFARIDQNIQKKHVIIPSKKIFSSQHASTAKQLPATYEQMIFVSTIPATSSFSKTLQTMYSSTDIPLNTLQEIQQVYFVLEYFAKLEKIQHDKAHASLQNKYAKLLQPTDNDIPFISKGIDLSTDPDWQKIKITQQDVIASEMWQYFLKATIADIFVHNGNFLQVIHEVESQIFNYIPSMETSYYNSDFLGLRNLAEGTRLKLLLNDIIGKKHQAQCIDWAKLSARQLQSASSAFQSTDFYTFSHNITMWMQQDSKGKTVSSKKTSLKSPTKEQIFCYAMIKAAQNNLYSALAESDNVENFIAQASNSSLLPNIFEYTLNEYVYLDDFFMIQANLAAQVEQNNAPTKSSSSSSIKNTDTVTVQSFHDHAHTKKHKKHYKTEELVKVQDVQLITPAGAKNPLMLELEYIAPTDPGDNYQYAFSSADAFGGELKKELQPGWDKFVSGGQQFASGVQQFANNIPGEVTDVANKTGDAFKAAGEGIAGATEKAIGQATGNAALEQAGENNLNQAQSDAQSSGIIDFGNSIRDQFVALGGTLENDFIAAGYAIRDGVIQAGYAIRDGFKSAGEAVGGIGCTLIGDVVDGLHLTSFNFKAEGQSLINQSLSDLQQCGTELNSAVNDFGNAIKDGIIAPMADIDGAMLGFITQDQSLGLDMTTILNQVSDSLVDIATTVLNDAANNIIQGVASTIILTNDIVNVIMTSIAAIGYHNGGDVGSAWAQLGNDMGVAILNGINGLISLTKDAFAAIMKTLTILTSAITTIIIDVSKEATFMFELIATGNLQAAKTDEASVGTYLDNHRQTIDMVSGIILAVAIDVAVTVATGGAGTAEAVVLTEGLTTGADIAGDAAVTTAETLGESTAEAGAETGADVAGGAGENTGNLGRAALKAPEPTPTAESPTQPIQPGARPTTSEPSEPVEPSQPSSNPSEPTKPVEPSPAPKIPSEEPSPTTPSVKKTPAQKTQEALSTLKTATTNTRTAATEARTAATTARTSATTTRTAASAARSSANKAEQAATQAETEAEQAESAATQAEQAGSQDANSLRQSANEAKQAANQTRDTANQLDQDATNAEKIADQAESSATKAEQKANQLEDTATKAEKSLKNAEDAAGKAAKKPMREMSHMLFSESMNAVFNGLGVIGSAYQDELSNAQEISQEEGVKNIISYGMDTALNACMQQNAMIQETKMKFNANLANQQIGLALLQNFITTVDVTAAYQSEAIGLGQEYTSLLTPTAYDTSNPTITGCPADIGYAWGLVTQINSLYPQTGMYSTTTGRALFPYAQEIAQAPLVIDSQVSTSSQNGINPQNHTQQLWFNQRAMIPLSSHKATDPLQVEMQFRKIYSLETTTYTGLYLGGTFEDYRSSNYLNTLETTGMVDLTVTHLAKMFVIIHLPNGTANIGLYENGGLGNIKDPHGNSWIVYEPLDKAFTKGWPIYDMQATLQNDQLSLTLSRTDIQSVAPWKKTVKVTPTDQRMLGVITSGTAIEWNILQPNLPIKQVPSFRNNSSSKSAPIVLIESDREIQSLQTWAQILHPTFGSFALDALSKYHCMKGNYIYTTTNTNMKDSANNTLTDYVVFANNTASGVENIGLNPYAQTTDASTLVLISLGSGNIYDSTGKIIGNKKNIWDTYNKAHGPFAPAIANSITTMQAACLAVLLQPKIGVFNLQAADSNLISNGIYIYTTLQTLNNNNSKNPITDYLITSDIETSNGFTYPGSIIGAQPSSTTKGFLSLITGNLYLTNSIKPVNKPGSEFDALDNYKAAYQAILAENQAAFGAIMAKISSSSQAYTAATKPVAIKTPPPVEQKKPVAPTPKLYGSIHNGNIANPLSPMGGISFNDLLGTPQAQNQTSAKPSSASIQKQQQVASKGISFNLDMLQGDDSAPDSSVKSSQNTQVKQTSNQIPTGSNSANTPAAQPKQSISPAQKKTSTNSSDTPKPASDTSKNTIQQNQVSSANKPSSKNSSGSAQKNPPTQQPSQKNTNPSGKTSSPNSGATNSAQKAVVTNNHGQKQNPPPASNPAGISFNI